jgi:hypothetical protein
MATYPIQLSQPFRQGDAISPVCAIAGVAIPTQTNILCRWPDGSVKLAVFTVILTGNAGELVTLQFKEGTPLGTTPGTSISFDASMEILGVQRFKSALPATVYISGPLATTYIHADHTGANDLQGISPTKCRPIFHVTHWHTQNKVKIRFIGECTNIAAMGQCGLGDIATPMRLRINGVEVYSLSGRQWFDQMMAYASRFTRVFWLNGAPTAPAAIKHNVAYIGQTGASHTFDHTVVVSEAAVASMYTQWTNVVAAGNHQILKPGLWVKPMGNAGGSDYVGPWTTWVMLWLYTGDRRMLEVCEGQANLGCQWPMHYRENGAAGDFYSVENHTSCQLLNIASNLARSGVTAVDDLDSWGWNPDTSHQPDHYFGMYLLLAHEFFYFEQAAFWASWSTAFYNHAGITAEFGCGPTGAEGGIPGLNSLTIRGQAWVFRSRCEVAAYCPDARLAEKNYFNRMAIDAIEIWEGERNITTTPYNGSANWNWGRSITPSEHPLRYWQHGNGNFIQNPNGTANGDVDPSRASAGLSTWEQNFLALALIRGLELGFATGALIAWLSYNIQGQQENLTWNIASNRSPTRDPSGNFFTTWADVLACYDVTWAANEGIDYDALFLAKVSDLNHGYTNIARAAARAMNVESAWMATNGLPDYTTNPKWAIKLRLIAPPPPPDPPPPPEEPPPPPPPPTPSNNAAAYVTQLNVPITMTLGQVVSVTIRMQNIGDTTWSEASLYRLCSMNPIDNTTWTAPLNRVSIVGTVAPNATYDFVFNMTAPAVAGTYNFQWQMVQELVERFGQLTQNVAVVVAPPEPPPPTPLLNGAQYIIQTDVPMTMTVGDAALVSITMKNTGDTDWNTVGGYHLGSQNPQDNFTWGVHRAEITGTVAPNASYTFTFQITAPATPGTYNFQWKMVQDFVEWFGNFTQNVAIVAIPVTVMTTYYVATTGNNANPGTIGQPFLTLQKAHDIANPGDTIYMRGGTYLMPTQTSITRSGSSGSRISVFNYPSEVPILDGSSNPNTGGHSIIRVNTSVSWWHFKGLEVKSSPGYGFYLVGNASNIIIENCNVHHNLRLDNSGGGIQIEFGSNILILNNDLHHNGHAGSEGGSGSDIGSQLTGNVFRGNRAWRNNDNGMAFFDAANVLIENNWVWENGYNDALVNIPPGDGVGFKLGGSGTGDGNHIVRNNLAWRNYGNAFDANSANLPMNVFNNTAYDNGGANFHFFNGTVAYVLKNNLSFAPGVISIGPSTLATFNSWNLSVTVNSADFTTLDFTANLGARNADGSLPVSDFLKLASGSDLIDKGTDVGIAYTGIAPDLGAYEHDFVAPPQPPTVPDPPSSLTVTM